jgi:hypothetical protein
VICGDAIFTFEHIEPGFANASEHDPKKITLLCGSHQLESTKGLLSKSKIRDADQHPYCKQLGHARHIFDLGGARPIILLGGNDFTECGPRIVIEGETLFEVFAPERHSHRWRLSAQFKDSSDRVICEIKENELLINSENSDVQQTARRFSMSINGTLYLEMELQPPTSMIIRQFCMETHCGIITIGEDDDPSFLRAVGPSESVRSRKQPVMTFKSGDMKIVFAKSSFCSPDGIILRFKNGGLQFGGGG